jgi:hypothetical protein
MTIDALNDLPTSGRWVKLKNKGDKITGTLVGADWRDLTDLDGNPVRARKTGKQRRELILTLQVQPTDADDDGIRKVPLKESGQRAVNEAEGKTWAIGGEVTIGVVADPETTMSQPTFKAKYTAPAKAVAALAGEEDPF